MLSPATATESVPSTSSPSQRKLDAKLLREIDPDRVLPEQERKHRLALAKKSHMRALVTKRLEFEGGELETLITLVATAIVRQARRMAAKAEVDDGAA